MSKREATNEYENKKPILPTDTAKPGVDYMILLVCTRRHLGISLRSLCIEDREITMDYSFSCNP